MARYTAHVTTTADSVRTRLGGSGGERMDRALGSRRLWLQALAWGPADHPQVGTVLARWGRRPPGTRDRRDTPVQTWAARRQGAWHPKTLGRGRGRIEVGPRLSPLHPSFFPWVWGDRSGTWTLCIRWKQVNLREGPRLQRGTEPRRQQSCRRWLPGAGAFLGYRCGGRGARAQFSFGRWRRDNQGTCLPLGCCAWVWV